ncbi:MAG: hypothetical protein JKY43_07525 [Phycisphaerales bacterium]|nr:hypothetical protein [Phycisphaerales bacterium]
MNQNLSTIEAILNLSSLSHLTTKEAVRMLGAGIDAAWDTKNIEVLKHIVDILAISIDIEQMNQDDVCLFHYFLANAWNGIKFLSSSASGGSWDWESQAVEQETLSIRRALSSSGLTQQPAIRVCQIHTNLANCYDTTGRFVEAISEWDRALQIEPRFGMARGNRASGLWTYANSIYDNGHAVVMAREAWTQLDPDKLEGLEPGADKYFASVRAKIESKIPHDVLTKPFDLNGFDLGETHEEQEYRQWCLNNKLFLNPLNDLGPVSIAAQDILSCPSIVAKIGEGPRFHDFMNQIKQEYCSARWLVYDASRNQSPHFSDKDVLLYNTLDYPSYGLRTEQLKLGFRGLFSLFDKIAFFLNAYLDLGIAERRVSFRGLWYVNQERAKGICSDFTARENWPLRGLFWLGKDLYEDTDGYRDVIDPAAKRLNEIRNHLEHKYLKLHSDLWNGANSSTFTDGLAVSLGRDEFEEMSMHLLSMTRAAIIYLALGVHSEEMVRANQRDPNTITPPMPLDNWEDDWKS